MRGFDVTDRGSAIRRKIIPDITAGGIVVESEQDTDEVLRWNKALLNAERSSSSLWGGSSWVRVASVPLILLEKWWKEEGLNYNDKNDWPRIVGKLNSSDYAALRTAPGVL